jgi:hypothetical protein
MIKVTEREIFEILSGKISGAINRTVLKAFAQEGLISPLSMDGTILLMG